LWLVLVALAVYFYINGKGGSFDVSQSVFDLSQATPQMNALFSAIEQAEGSDPQYNNPLDICPPGWTGQTFGAGIPVFSSPTEGRQRGMYELWLIATGKSSVYSLSDSISVMAGKWTATDSAAWASNVAAALGVTTDTTLAQILGASSPAPTLTAAVAPCTGSNPAGDCVGGCTCIS
jgi:hypothetical protein